MIIDSKIEFFVRCGSLSKHRIKGTIITQKRRQFRNKHFVDLMTNDNIHGLIASREQADFSTAMGSPRIYML
jgi:CelD/BcsL family acetyltransferase involved in cellulose biosynthesis